MSVQEKVLEFHKAFGLDINQSVTFKRLDLRYNLLYEEYHELTNEIEGNPGGKFNYIEEVTPNLIKEMSDLVYVIYGMAISFGIDLDKAIERTHISNMSKLDEDGKPIYREDGKVLKGDGYRKPIMDDLVPIIRG